MSYIKAAVYSPPENSDLPYVAVIFSTDGEVLTSRAVSSIQAGELLIQNVLSSLAKEAGTKIEIISGKR